MQSQVAELFSVTKVPYGDSGKIVRGVYIACGHCGLVEHLPVNIFPGRNGDGDGLEIQFVKRKMEARGWKIGTRAGHRWPKCFSSIKATAARRPSDNGVANGETPVSVTPIKSVQEAATRMLGRDDRRIIFEKLNEVYVNDKVGYSAGWTDERVSTDLGVPGA